MHIGETDYKKNDLRLNVFLTNNIDQTFSQKINLKSIGNFDEEIVWKLTSDEWNNIEKYAFVVEYWYGNMQDQLAVKLNISQIKEIHDLLFECPIEIYEENIVIKIKINIKVEMPEGKKILEPDGVIESNLTDKELKTWMRIKAEPESLLGEENE